MNHFRYSIDQQQLCKSAKAKEKHEEKRVLNRRHPSGSTDFNITISPKRQNKNCNSCQLRDSVEKLREPGTPSPSSIVVTFQETTEITPYHPQNLLCENTLLVYLRKSYPQTRVNANATPLRPSSAPDYLANKPMPFSWPLIQTPRIVMVIYIPTMHRAHRAHRSSRLVQSLILRYIHTSISLIFTLKTLRFKSVVG